jgi:hypothetical protein
MRVTKRYLTLFMLILFTFLTNVAFSEPEKPPTIHALLIIADADPTIGRAVDVDKARIEGMLKVASGICRVKTQTLLSSKNEFRSEQILQWLKDVKPDANDTIFIYYSGHGGMNKNKETFLYLQDGYFFRSKFSSSLESAKNCRLKILVTDCCSDGPESEVGAYRAVISKKALQDLFLGHKGYLHITAASEGEYSWCSPRYGGWFTRAMVDSFDDTSDTNMDGFVSWEEVFNLTRDAVQKKFGQTFAFFSADQKKDMSNKGIGNQTPKWYSMASRVEDTNAQTTSQDSSNEPQATQEATKVPETPEPKDTLWTISNPNSSFSITIATDKSEYNTGENVYFRIKATANCNIIVLNWNSKGEPIQLYPNKYESSSFIVRDKEYMIPASDPKYDLRVSGSKGEEKIKVLALINRTDSLKLRSLVPLDDGSGSVFSRVTVVPRKTMTGEDTEAKIIEAIRMMNPSDWITTSCTIQIR